jgi:hypothetical protein
MTQHPFKVQVEEMLVKYGGFYEFDDIVELVRGGKMQSFSRGESWIVTQICEFPRKRVLDVVFVVGNLDELKEMVTDVIGFARESGAEFMMATGRRGFIEHALGDDWTLAGHFYVRDLSDGS